MNVGTAATSDDMSGERVRNQRGPPPPRRNRRSVCFRAPDRAIGRTSRIAFPFGGPRHARDRKRKEKEETEVPRYRRSHGKSSRDDRTAAARISKRSLRTPVTRNTTCLFGSAGHDQNPFASRPCISAPWYVRWDLFAKRADQVTVYVLLGAEFEASARFFVVQNSDLAAQFRQPPTWKAFGFIDVKSVEKYEDNWDILR